MREEEQLLRRVDDLQCTAAFVQRTGVSTGVMDKKKKHV